MNALNIGTRREVCWDEALMEQTQGVTVQMHKPQYREIVFECDKPWEGNVSGYFTLVPDEGRLRIYYRGMSHTVTEIMDPLADHKPFFCYAESDDGRTFRRVNVGSIPFWGSLENNILRDDIADNMFFF